MDKWIKKWELRYRGKKHDGKKKDEKIKGEQGHGTRMIKKKQRSGEKGERS